MKRIYLLGAVIAGLFIFGVAGASAATTAKHKAGKTKSHKVATKKVTCAWAISQQVPASDQTNSPGDVSGHQAGAAKCTGGIGSGAEFDSFATDDSGNVTGKFQQWFNTGSLYGTYTMAQAGESGPPSTTTFGQAAYAGTIVLKNGTGAYAKFAGKGTIACATLDGVHFVCKAVMKVKLPAVKTAKK